MSSSSGKGFDPLMIVFILVMLVLLIGIPLVIAL